MSNNFINDDTCDNDCGCCSSRDFCADHYKHNEQPNENYFEEMNDYLDGTMNV